MTVPENIGSRWKHLVDFGLWPKKAVLDSGDWLSNFPDTEKSLAVRLLDGFTYFSEELVKQMFRGAFLNVSQIVVSQKGNYLAARREWERFIKSLIVVRVTGENPSDTDSGYLFCRFARDVLGIPDEQILAPHLALTDLLRRRGGSVLFVDDFVGSGHQFIETFNREYSLESGLKISFKSFSMAHRGNTLFLYCPIICTSLGLESIKIACPDVQVSPAHTWDERYSAMSTSSIIWGEDMQSEGPEFVKAASLRAGIPDRNGEIGCWQGFCKLGLALAFSHGCPDATLPLFSWANNGWRPLIKFRSS